MTQKLLVLERDTKEELQEAIRKNILESGLRLYSFSVIEQVEYTKGGLRRLGDPKPQDRYYFEAWCIIEVPDNTNRFYKAVEEMGMTE